MVAFAYAHLDVFVCVCLGFGCFVLFACRHVKVAVIAVTLLSSGVRISFVCCPRRCRLSSCLSRLSVCASCARAACIPTRTVMTMTCHEVDVDDSRTRSLVRSRRRCRRVLSYVSL